jgi:hypothetical protein
MSQDNNHDEWLSLIEISGPFLAVPVLKKAFPQGLEAVDGRVRKYLRQAYDEWCEARDNDDPQLKELHRAWIHEVLARGLEYDEKDSGELLKRGEGIPAILHIALPEHGVTLSPDYALVNDQKALLLIQTCPADTDLDAAISQQGWVAAPSERMVQLCRATGCRLGLVTNGERWLLIDAPVGSVVTYASWYARLWGQEPLTLQAFLTLLGIRRFFVDASEQLPALFDESLQHQEEVTDALGEQVRRAVEVLIQSLDKEDLNSARTLLQDVEPTQLYEAGLTIMMRLVFLLSAEERGLLLMGDEAYEANYAISTLRMQLRKESDEVLERRHDAWARLLATFRAVYGGIEHETLRLPALGGSLFDPDRFPFLEGRPTGSSWHTDDARPLPIDNRTVLLLLEAIQQYQGRTLSYRALDVEQIGYVYEGLLERTVKRTDSVTVELVGGKGAKKTIYVLSELEAIRKFDKDEFTRQLASPDALRRSESAIRKSLARPVDVSLTNHLLTACHGDEATRDRLLPIANLLRSDPWGYPLVYAKGAFIVTTGSDRRETGTHYTPKSLTEAIVAETLAPIVYVGAAEGAQREQWKLKSPAELLDLKICDPAMGSGAFLVQVCRWLSDRLVEAWSQVEALGNTVNVDGEVLNSTGTQELLPSDSEARMVIARRLIAERCLYGVDLNPLAVELAKLSIWLVTLAKGRPFGFLDHNLRCGDSLLGIHRLDQLTELSMTPSGKGQQRLFGKNVEKAVHEAIELRQRLREIPIRDIHDVEAMACLDADARHKLEVPELIADAFIGEALASGGNGATLGSSIVSLGIHAEQAVDGDQNAILSIKSRALTVATNASIDKLGRKPFHWPLEFPEVFTNKKFGFDAVIGNPPFMGGQKISGVFGVCYRDYLVGFVAAAYKGSADLCAYFALRANQLLRNDGTQGMVLSSAISEGGTRVVGLGQLLEKDNNIFSANSRSAWPGKASVTISLVWVVKGSWSGCVRLNNENVQTIDSTLSSGGGRSESPKRLESNFSLSFQGSIPLGKGFVIPLEEAEAILSADKKYSDVIYGYLTGQELNIDPEYKPSQLIINFSDWPLDVNNSPAGYSGPVAADYPECLKILEARVKPERDKVNRKVRRERWWQYAERAKGLYSAIQNLKWSLAIATQATKYVAFGRVSGRNVYSNAIAVIASDDFSVAAVVSSSLHDVWSRRYGSYNLMLIRYSPSDLFDTFPLPRSSLDELRVLGEKYFIAREGVMLLNGIGLTEFYNAIHNPGELDVNYQSFRALQIKLDCLVASAYGWGDIDLEHGFHSVSYLAGGDEVRFTISDRARLEVLKRLLVINDQRYQEESAQKSLVGAQATASKVRARQAKSKYSTKSGDLFDGGNV